MALTRKDIESLAFHLRAALNVLEDELEPIVVPPEIAAEVARKIDSGICLAWDHKIDDGVKVLRGLCETDYHTTMARIRRGEESERQLMMTGKLGPRQKPGRKAARDVAAEQAAKERKVAELAKKYNQRKTKDKPQEDGS